MKGVVYFGKIVPYLDTLRISDNSVRFFYENYLDGVTNFTCREVPTNSM